MTKQCTFHVGDYVRRINRYHLGIEVGDVQRVIDCVGEEDYVLTGQNVEGTHKEHNLVPATEAEYIDQHPEENQMKAPYYAAPSLGCQPAPTPVAIAQHMRETRVEDLRAELEAAEAALATQNSRAEFTDSINKAIRITAATVQALSDARDIENNGDIPHARAEYAEFRKFLVDAIAEYGYKVVLVGNKSKGMVVKS